MSNVGELPIGSVVAYAGREVDDALSSSGWLVCDGSLIEKDDHPALYAVIGTMYGASGTSWALPDYRGRFLRGLDAGRGLDPDAGTREPANADLPETGNSGDEVGSTQGDAFDSHAHDFQWHGKESNKIQAGFGDNSNCVKTDQTSTSTSTSAGGGAETRPLNIAVRFLIKSREDASSPPGTVVAHGQNAYANGDGESWLSCDGSLLDVTRAPVLWTAIGMSNGGIEPSRFALPDYRGVFLRGLDDGAGRDPDASSRESPRPDLPNPGASGDHTGSLETDALEDHDHQYTIYSHEKSVMRETQNNLVKHNQSGSLTSAETGGAESRPVNSYAEYLIASGETPSSPPIGAITAYAGDDPSSLADGGWLFCDGRLLPEKNYPELFAVIGVAYGGDGNTGFALPDLRGAFIRGRDAGSGRDPDAATRTSPQAGTLDLPGASRDNVGSWQVDEFVSHSHQYTEWKDDINTDNGLAGRRLLNEWSTSSFDETGGNETRPINSAVNWIIRSN